MRVLVLGDSCSAGLGAHRSVYPAVLHGLLGAGHRVENHAVPGFTSADAARYFRVELARRSWDAVVVYLGNTDGAYSVRKGRFRWWHGLRRSPTREHPAVTRIALDRPIVFDEHGDRLPPATTPAEFAANLTGIARTARRRGARVVLMNPIANDRFPPGLMGPNAAFLRVLGMPARIAHRLTATEPHSRRLVAALAAHEGGDLLAAARGYRELAEEAGPVVASIAGNNLAVALHEHGGPAGDTECARLLHELAARPEPVAAVAAGNLARLHNRHGEAEPATAWAARAVELDTNLYRVKPAYRARIAGLSGPGVTVLDLAELLGTEDFVDYCHPDPAAHRRIATALADLLRPGNTGDEPDAAYVRVHPGPHAALDPTETMSAHFAMAPAVAPHEITRTARQLLDRAVELGGGDLVAAEPVWPEPDSDLAANVCNALVKAAAHPAITSLAELRARPPELPHEIGRFPEYYLDRLLAERTAAVSGVDLPERAHRRLAPDRHRERILGPAPANPPDAVAAPAGLGRRILDRVRRLATASETLFADQRPARVTGVKFWYLRDAFHHGTPSRPGMLYAHAELDAVADALALAAAHARRDGDEPTTATALALLVAAERLADVHRWHAVDYVRHGYDTGNRDYTRELAAVRALFADSNVDRPADREQLASPTPPPATWEPVRTATTKEER